MPEDVQNYNIAITTNFKLEVPGERTYNYFVQSFSLPGVVMDGIQTDHQNWQAFMPGNQIMYADLQVQIILDEDYLNWTNFHDWVFSFKDEDVWYNLTKDIKLHILNANKNQEIIFTFVHAFPTNIGAIDLTSAAVGAEPIIFPVEFKYQYYTYERVGL